MSSTITSEILVKNSSVDSQLKLGIYVQIKKLSFLFT